MQLRNIPMITLLLWATATLSSQTQVCGDYDNDGVRDISDIAACIDFFMTPDGIGPIGQSDFGLAERLTMHDYLFLLSRVEQGNWDWRLVHPGLARISRDARGDPGD